MNNLELQEKEIDEEIKTIWPNSAGLDGIANIKEYLSHEEGQGKILWILKEAGKPTNDNGLAYDYRKRFKEAADYPRWKTTWGNMAEVSLGIQLYTDHRFNNLSASNLPKLELYEKESEPHAIFDGEESYPLSGVAVINVKKGGSNRGTSKQNQIIAEYTKPGVKELLMRQIDYINPNIIIIGCKVEKLAEDLTSKKIDDYIKINDLTCYTDDGKRLFIYTHHPCLMGLPEGMKKENYIDSIFDAVKAVY